MSPSRPSHLRSLGAASAALVAILCSSPARAQCETQALNTGAPVSVSGDTLCWFHQHASGWMAAGIRSAPGSDWNLQAFASASPAPACVADPLTASGTSGVDLVLAQFDYTPFTGFYLPVQRASGTGPAAVEWEAGSRSLTINAAPVSLPVHADGVLEVWNVTLSAGVPYTFAFERTGVADLRLWLFDVANASGGMTWVSGSARVVESATPFTYTPTTSGVHGVVIVNASDAEGQHALRVTDPTALDVAGLSIPRAMLFPARPNPARDEVVLPFALGAPGRVELLVLDLAGRCLARLEQACPAGSHGWRWDRTRFDGSRVGAGLYFARLRVDGRFAGWQRTVLLD